MSTSTDDTLGPGQYPPFATVTDDDHRAWIIIAAALGVSFVAVTLITRILIRRFVNRGWALDDSIAVGATAVFFIQSSLVLDASAEGLGKSIHIIPASRQGTVQKLYYASNILYVLALDLSKLSSILLIRRLTSPKSPARKYVDFLLVVLPCLTVAFMLAAALQCDLRHPWKLVDEQCSGWIVRWDVQGAVSSLYEVAMFIGPAWLATNLQRPLATKIQVVTPFAFRLIIVAFTIVRLTQFDYSGLSSNPTLREARFICWTQAELSFGIMAATFPVARRLAVDLITYYRGGGYGTTNASNSKRSETVQLTSLRSSRALQAGRRKSVKEGDNGNDSREMIIRKEVTVEVEHSSNPFNRSNQRPGLHQQYES